MNSDSPRVFLVDDDPVQVLYLGSILRVAGHRVEAFDHPEALLSRLSLLDRGCVSTIPLIRRILTKTL